MMTLTIAAGTTNNREGRSSCDLAKEGEVESGGGADDHEEGEVESR